VAFLYCYLRKGIQALAGGILRLRKRKLQLLPTVLMERQNEAGKSWGFRLRGQKVPLFFGEKSFLTRNELVASARRPPDVIFAG